MAINRNAGSDNVLILKLAFSLHRFITPNMNFQHARAASRGSTFKKTGAAVVFNYV